MLDATMCDSVSLIISDFKIMMASKLEESIKMWTFSQHM